MRTTSFLIVALLLSACGKPKQPEVATNLDEPIIDMASDNYTGANAVATTPTPVGTSRAKVVHSSDEIKTSVSITEGTPEQILYLVPVGDESKRDAMASLMRESGFDCNNVSSVYQLKQEDGEYLDVFKVACDTGNFQLTMLNDKVFIKGWTGRLLGH